MTTLAKVLIGTAVVAGVGAITAIAVASDKKEETVEVRSDGKVVEMPVKKEDTSLLSRIKKYVKRKVIKFLTFVALNADKFEAASTLIGLGSGIIAITKAIRDFKKGSDLEMKIDELTEKVDTIADWQLLTAQATNHNNKVFAVAAEHICNKVGVDGDELRKDMEALMYDARRA